MNNIIYKNKGEIGKQNNEIQELMKSYLKNYNNITTIRRYAKVLIDFFKFSNFKNVEEIKNTNYADMIELVNNYKNTKKVINIETTEILNPSTINNISYILKSFFSYLNIIGIYEKNPLDLFKKLKTKENSDTQSLDRLELISILQHTKNQYIPERKGKRNIGKLRDYLIFAFLSLSLRRNEICNLEWKNINFQKNYINVLQKGGSYKTLPIPTGLLEDLLVYKEILEQNRLLSKYIFTSLLYNEKNIKNISSNYIFQLVKKTCKKLHIHKNITPHSFRKTFIELCLDKNENYNNIMNSTGHKSVQLIRYYDNRDKLKNNSINQVDWF